MTTSERCNLVLACLLLLVLVVPVMPVQAAPAAPGTLPRLLLLLLVVRHTGSTLLSKHSGQATSAPDSWGLPPTAVCNCLSA